MATQITYESAMATLQGMFPGLDADVLHTVLRDNEGHLERTIDSLLTLDDHAPNPPMAPSNDDGFLTLGSEGRDFPSAYPPGHSQIDADEEYARMLQEELFLQELQNNPEFLAQLEAEEREIFGLSSSAHVFPAPRTAGSGSGPSANDELGRMRNGQMEEIRPLTWKEKLGKMSASTREKFRTMWRKYSKDDSARYSDMRDMSDGAPLIDDEDEDGDLRRKRL